MTMDKTYISPSLEIVDVKVATSLCENSVGIYDSATSSAQLTTERESSTADKDSWANGLW